MRLLVVLIVALCALTGCGVEAKDAYTKVRSDRSPLIDGFVSYASLAEVEAQLKRAGLRYSVGKANSLAPHDPRPTYEVIEIKIPVFIHFNQSGELNISFFNNRLTDTRFFPTDPDAYLADLRKGGIQVAEQRALIGNTVVWTHQAHDGRRYVGWADSRLDEEHSKWISRYS